jgi:hypothetical protein
MQSTPTFTSPAFSIHGAHAPALRYREVVVIVPMGNYNQPQELGRYMHESIARNIISTLALPEYKMFFLDTGAEVLVH